MAKRKVMVDVVVDDKGTTKKMAVDQRQLKKAMDGTAVSSRNARKQIRGAAQTASASGKQFAALSSGTGGLVGAYATLAAQIFAVTAAFNFLKEAGSLKLLQEGQLAYTSAVGTSMKALTLDIQEATGAQLRFREAAQAAAIGTAAGLSPTQITALGKAAKDTSTVLGRDLTDSFNRLVRGVTKAEPELLDELGIILRLEKATKDYSTALGITGELTAFQRSQAVTADVLAQVEEKYSRVLAVTGASENEFAKLATAFDEIVMSIQEFSVKFLTPVAQILQEFPALIIAAFAPFTISILRAGLPSLANLSTGLTTFATNAEASFAKAQAAQLKYATDVKKLAASQPMQKALLKEIGAETKAATKKVKINKGSLLAKLRDGKQLSNAQLKQIEANLAREARGYKIKDKQILASLRASMKKMELYNAATTEKMKAQFQTLGIKIKTTFKQAQIEGQLAMGGLAAFTAKAATKMATALSIVSWVSLVASLGALIFAFFRQEKQMEETESRYNFLIEKNKVLREETEKFIKTQNILNEEFERGNKILGSFGARIENVSSAQLKRAMGELKNMGSVIQEFDTQVLQVGRELPGLQAELEAAQQKAAAARKAQSDGTGNNQAGSIKARKETIRAAAKAQEDFNEKTDQANKSFIEFTKTTAGLDKGAVAAIDTLAREAQELEGLTNERFKNNMQVKEYLRLLQDFFKTGKGDINLILQQRDAVADLGNTFRDLERQTSANIQKSKELTQKLLPITETDAYIEALEQERLGFLKLIDTNKKETDQEKERLAAIKDQLEFFRSVSGTETTVKAASLAITVAETKALAGKTKLLSKDIKQRAKIAQNRVKEFELEQKIAQAQFLQQDAVEKIQKLRDIGAAKRTDEQNRELQAMQNSFNSREKSIVQNAGNLALLQAQNAELERQLNNVEQLKDSMAQSFESGLQSGLAKFIKAEQQFADAFRDMIKGVLNSIADTLAKQLTTSIMRRITGVKPPEQLMAEAITTATTTGASVIKQEVVAGLEVAGTSLANKIRAANGAPLITEAGTTETSVTTNGNGNGNGNGTTKAGSIFGPGYLFGKGGQSTVTGGRGEIDPKHGEVEEVLVSGSKIGIFRPFLDNFKAIFEENTLGGFIGQLGKTFLSGAKGFGNLFQDLIGTIGTGGMGGTGLLGLLGFRYGGRTPSYRYGGMSRDRYSAGGIARGPQSGYPAILHGNEAIVPLPSGGKIPVEMKSGGPATTNNVGVTVNMSGEGVTSNVSGDPGQGEQLGRAISAAVQEELHRQRRPGGILSPYGAAGGI